MTETRRPAGYLGANHETSGRDVLAILKTVNSPEQILGAGLTARLKKMTPDGWYPIGDLLEMLERLDAKLGAYHLKSVGWGIIQSLPVGMIEKYETARGFLDAMQSIYAFNNQEEGILEEGLRRVGVSAKVTQSACFRKGAPLCHYVVEAKSVDARWG